MDYDDRLQRKIDKISTVRYLSTKAEIIDYYRDNHPKGKTWKQAITGALSEITGLKPKNLEKRFDPQRLNNVEKKNADQYKELGQKIGPIERIPPSEGIEIYFYLDLKISDECGNFREFTVQLTGPDAYDVANGGGFTKLMQLYFGKKKNVVDDICKVLRLQVHKLKGGKGSKRKQTAPVL